MVAYGIRVSSPEPTATGAWPAVLTWRAHDATRMESTRVQLSGKRIRAHGRIVAGANNSHPAFSASYDLATDETGSTNRLSLSTTLAERERQLSIARDEEGLWTVQNHEGVTRATFDGSLDVDVVFSPFFNTLPIRRAGLYQAEGSAVLPVVYVTLPDLTVSAATISYRTTDSGIKVVSPVADTVVTVDSEGFLLEYPNLAVRI